MLRIEETAEKNILKHQTRKTARVIWKAVLEKENTYLVISRELFPQVHMCLQCDLWLVGNYARSRFTCCGVYFQLISNLVLNFNIAHSGTLLNFEVVFLKNQFYDITISQLNILVSIAARRVPTRQTIYFTIGYLTPKHPICQVVLFSRECRMYNLRSKE